MEESGGNTEAEDLSPISRSLHLFCRSRTDLATTHGVAGQGTRRVGHSAENSPPAPPPGPGPGKPLLRARYKRRDRGAQRH